MNMVKENLLMSLRRKNSFKNWLTDLASRCSKNQITIDVNSKYFTVTSPAKTKTYKTIAYMFNKKSKYPISFPCEIVAPMPIPAGYTEEDCVRGVRTVEFFSDEKCDFSPLGLDGCLVYFFQYIFSEVRWKQAFVKPTVTFRNAVSVKRYLGDKYEDILADAALGAGAIKCLFK